ncbi:MAG TPA: ABC transporter permease subunit [Vicinamibacteria bacterium]|nr:ABC transporter permease subunit [Vicinamibacteria bacterium]
MAAAAPAAPLDSRQRVAAQSGRLRRVKLLDRLAVAFITLGGLFVIVAVFFIFLFILGETVPLFRPAAGTPAGHVVFAARPEAGKPLVMGSDEYQMYFYEVLADGRTAVWRTDGSFAKEVLPSFLDAASVASASRSLTDNFVAIGTGDGRVALQQVRFLPRYKDQKLVDLEIEVRDRGVVALDESKRPIREVAYDEKDGRKTVIGVPADDEILFYLTDDEGGEHRGSLKTRDGERVTRVRIARSDTLIAATDKGSLHHWELTPEVRLTEVVRVSDEPVTAVEMSLGGVTALVGDAKGNLTAWFRVRQREEDTDLRFVRAHSYAPQGAPIAAIGPSTRDKSFVTAGADGSLVLRHMTSERTLVAFPASGTPVESVMLTPKMDGILAKQPDGRLARYEISSPHPEVSWRALFGKVWYEGYAEPEYVWQSTGGTDDFETKFSMVPVVFGTIKGTAYALLFAIPLAVMGALYTSQFMHPSIKAKVKPTVEIMAALPSVVVGFIAGLWLASRVEREIVPVLLMIVLLPLFGTSGFLVWERLPRTFRDRLRPGMEIAVIVPLLMLGAWCAAQIGPAVEAGAFGGDFRLWLKSALDLVYDQRNCLVVGLAMGFAVIPIIFTIAEDAFTSVPQHLTAASLALGASRWQTAVRVVLPTASPGIFSAVMIGFGRAVGETMIVLMATGNTPVLDWSIFNGMRTLSANIAVEIPEAPYGGTLYRTLFLAGLLLFMMTFFVNTLAELVRQRLRERYKAI